MNKVLIDSDVILDFFFDRKPFSEYSMQLFLQCENRTIKGFVTPVIVSNVYYLLRQNATHGKVIEKLTQLLSFLNVLMMDKEIVVNALHSEFKDFEDALQYFSALKHRGIDAILTRNIKDYKKSVIGVLTPETYLKTKNTSSNKSK